MYWQSLEFLPNWNIKEHSCMTEALDGNMSLEMLIYCMVCNMGSDAVLSMLYMQ